MSDNAAIAEAHRRIIDQQSETCTQCGRKIVKHPSHPELPGLCDCWRSYAVCHREGQYFTEQRWRNASNACRAQSQFNSERGCDTRLYVCVSQDKPNMNG